MGRIRQSVGAIGDIRQLVMAGLMVADRLSEATRKIEDLQDQLDGLRISRDQALQQIRQQDENFAKALEIAAQKLEEMAQ